jgi:hypothetical protein
MPDGTLITAVPDNITQADLLARYNAFSAQPATSVAPEIQVKPQAPQVGPEGAPIPSILQTQEPPVPEQTILQKLVGVEPTRGPQGPGAKELASDVYAAAKQFPEQLASSVIQAYQGKDIEAIADQDAISNKIINDARKTAEANMAIKGAEDTYTDFLGAKIKRSDIRNLPQNLSFSLAAMGSALLSGLGTTAVTRNPMAGYGAGAAAAGKVAYNIDTNNFLRDFREGLNQASIEQRGIPITNEEFVKIAQSPEMQTKAKDFNLDVRGKGAVDELATIHGLHEAGWEAISSTVGLGAGKYIFKEALKGKILKPVAAFTGELGLELAGETATQLGQSNVERKAGMHEDAERSWSSAEDWKKSYKEVAGPTLLTTAVLGGAPAAVGAAKRAITKATQPPAPQERVEPEVTPPVAPAEAPATPPPIEPVTVPTKIDTSHDTQAMLDELSGKDIEYVPEEEVKPLEEQQSVLDEANKILTVFEANKTKVPVQYVHLTEAIKNGEITSLRDLKEYKEIYDVLINKTNAKDRKIHNMPTPELQAMADQGMIQWSDEFINSLNKPKEEAKPEILYSAPMGENTEYHVLKNDLGHVANLYDKDAGRYVPDSARIFPVETFGTQTEIAAKNFVQEEQDKAAKYDPSIKQEPTGVISETEKQFTPVGGRLINKADADRLARESAIALQQNLATQEVERDKQIRREIREEKFKVPPTQTLSARLVELKGIAKTEKGDMLGETGKVEGYDHVFRDNGGDLLTMVKDGLLDDYLPPDIRTTATPPDGLYDARPGYNYISDIMKTGEKAHHYDYEMAKLQHENMVYEKNLAKQYMEPNEAAQAAAAEIQGKEYMNVEIPTPKVTEQELLAQFSAQAQEYISEMPIFESAKETKSFKIEMNKLRRAIKKGLVSEADVIPAIDQIYESTQKDYEPSERIRGAEIIKEKLLAAKRRKELSPEIVDMALFLIDKNPALVKDLAISITASKRDGRAGGYAPLARLATIFKYTPNNETAVHEILHHLERMMPKDIQAAIRKAWSRSLKVSAERAFGGTNETLKKYYRDVIDYHTNGDEKAEKRAMSLLADNAVGYDHYQNFNPSEFWAVNGSSIVQNRYNADISESMVERIKNWLSEFVEKVKALFNLQSDAAVIRALNSVAKGDGKFITDMIHEDILLADITKKSAIEAFDKKSIENLSQVTHKNRSKLIEMPIDKFLKLAKPLNKDGEYKTTAREVLARGEKFKEIPNLWYAIDAQGNAKITGHEGRHRALALRDAGYTTMPVEFRGPIRWSEQQDPKLFDYYEKWPGRLKAEDGDYVASFPVKREDAELSYEESTAQKEYLNIEKPSNKPQAFIDSMFAKYPQNPYKPTEFGMTFGEGEDMKVAFFDLKPSKTDPNNAVNVNFFYTFPQREGVGTKAMKQLQDDAAAAGIDLELFPKQHGAVSSKALEKFYNKLGFNREKGRAFVWKAPIKEYANIQRPPRNFRGQEVLPQWHGPEESKTDLWIYRLQNKQIDTKRVQELIGDIEEDWNVYDKEQLYHGRTAAGIRNFLLKELLPIIKEIERLKISPEDVRTYLHNRHAEERNIQMNKINPDIYDETTGRTIPNPLKDKGSGISTPDARAYLAGLDPARKQILEQIATKFDQMVKGTQQILIDSGNESAETIAKWNKTYKHYVPLFRVEDEMARPSGMGGTGQGFGTRGNFSKRAMGSEKDVQDILSNIIAQRERALIRAEKTRVGRALYGMAIQNPNPDFWLPINPDAIKNKKQAIAELRRMGIPDAEDVVNNLMKEPKERYLKKINVAEGVVEPDEDFDFDSGLPVNESKEVVASKINVMARYKDFVFPVRINGKDRYIFFNKNDPRALRMVQSLKNLDVENLGWAVGIAGKFTRWFKNVNTQYNPVFGLVNFVRDFSGALLNLTNTEIKGEQAKVIAGAYKAMGGILNVHRAERKGKPLPTGPWAKLYQEARAEGFQTGYRDSLIRNQEEMQIIEHTLEQFKDSNTKKAFYAVIGGLTDFNDMMENAIRLSAYKVAIDKGLSKQKAAIIAKNLTVNFDKKGAWTAQVNALYAFFNASVQGTERIYRTITGPKGKMIIGGGILAGMVQAMMLAAAGYGDDDPPEFVREKNFIIPLPDGTYLTVPYPLGYNVLPNSGRIIMDFMLHGGRDPGKHSVAFLSSIVNSFNPLGSTSLSFQTLAPTIADPLVALGENKDAFGRPISRKDRATAPTPGYTRSRETASRISQGLAYFLNLASGGSKYQKGYISPTADELDFIAGQVGGGLYREVTKAGKAISAVVTGEEIPTYQRPILGRFAGKTGSQAAVSQTFYDNVTRMTDHENEIKGRMKNRENVESYLSDYPEARLWKRANSVENKINELNKRKRLFLERGFPKERIQAVDAQKTMLMQRFNTQVKNLRPD